MQPVQDMRLGGDARFQRRLHGRQNSSFFVLADIIFETDPQMIAPEADAFKAYINAAFVQKVFNIAKR